MQTDYLHDKGLDRILDDMEAMDAPAPDRAAQDDEMDRWAHVNRPATHEME